MTPNTDLKHFDKYRADFKPYGLTLRNVGTLSDGKIRQTQ